MHDSKCMHARDLKSAMKAAGMDDRTLSEKTGVHITLIRRYLHGEVAVGAKNAIKLARVLGVSLEQVLYGKS